MTGFFSDVHTDGLYCVSSLLILSQHGLYDTFFYLSGYISLCHGKDVLSFGDGSSDDTQVPMGGATD